MRAFGNDDRALNNVLHFANVTGPGVHLKQIEGFPGYPPDILSFFSGIPIDEVLDQHWNVFSPLPQRRNLNRKNVEAVEKILAECTGSYGGWQVTVRRDYHSHVGLDRPVSADALKLVFLKHAQERDLSLRWKLANFVKKYRAPFSQFETAKPAPGCTRERAFFMTEQLRRNQRGRDRGAINADEGSIGTLRAFVYCAGDQLLARACLAGD